MNRWYARLSAGVLALVICFTIASYFIGCSKDETGPTNPVINFQDQYFSIAVGNGNDTVHSGNNLVLLDWQNDTPAATKVVPYYNSFAPIPVIDGKADDEVWASAPETVVNLTLIPESVEPPPGSTPDPTGHDPITQVRIKAVYNWINPNIYFLITWQDPTQDIKKDAYEKYADGPPALWSNRLDYDQDWVSLMWSTWQWHLDADGNKDDLAELTTDFQNSGCDSTCHESARPYHLNGTMEDPFNPGTTISQMCDFWFWGSSISNYGGPVASADTTPYPAWLVDGYVDDISGIIGDYNDPDAVDADGLKYAYDKKYFCFQNDKGTPGYQHNTKKVTTVYPAEWVDLNQPTDLHLYYPYLWLSVAETTGFVSSWDWDLGDKVSGYINRAALGAAAQVFGLATYDTATQTWTLEINRPLDTGDVNDCILSIYDPHDYQ